MVSDAVTGWDAPDGQVTIGDRGQPGWGEAWRLRAARATVHSLFLSLSLPQPL